MAPLGYKPLLLLQHPLRLCKALLKKKNLDLWLTIKRLFQMSLFIIAN